MKYWKRNIQYKSRDIKYFAYLKDTDHIKKLENGKYEIETTDDEITEYLIRIFEEKTEGVDVDSKYREYLKLIKEYNRIKDVTYDLIEIYANMKNISIKEAEDEFF